MHPARAAVSITILLAALAAPCTAAAHRADTDRDGMPDSFERTYHLDPRSKRDAPRDADRDRLSNRAEFRAGTNPRRADTDGDGLRDGWEVAARLNPRDRRDAGQDPDGDGITNREEAARGTDPRRADPRPGGAPAQGTDPRAATSPQPPVSPPASSRATTEPVGFRPLSSPAAALRVRRSRWEARPGNAVYAHPPTSTQLAYFHEWDGRTDDCDLRSHVDGDFSGTTDETIQWTARKWGLDEDLVRAQMEAESGWDHDAWVQHPGDGGQSFGLSQIKVTVHHGFIAAAPGDGGSAAQSMSLNADYYGYVMRAAMNGCEGWLAGYDVPGHRYPPTDAQDALWGAVGRWYSGAWWTAAGDAYRATVSRHLADRDWAVAAWFYGAAG